MANFEDGAFATDGFENWMNRWRCGAEDWACGELQWKFPNTFDKFHYPYMCGMCKRGEICGVSLQRCKNCKAAYYCSREHQLKSWPIHKQACKHFKEYFENNYEGYSVNDKVSWRLYLIKGMRSLRIQAMPKDPLGHRMNEDEWIFQRHCQVCFYNPAAPVIITSDVPDAPSDERTLVECKTCHCAAHCDSPTCTEAFTKTHTKQACEKYAIGFVFIVMSMQQGTQLIVNTQTREKSLNPAANWSELFARKLHDFGVHEALLRMPPVMAMLTDGLSISYTILRGLILAYDVEQLSSMRRIEIHVLGVEAMESMCGETKYEELLHCLPNCKELVICLVSKMMFDDVTSRAILQQNTPNTVCDGCNAAKARLFIRPYYGFYHDIITTTPVTETTSCGSGKHKSNNNKLTLDDQVTLAIACHSGIHDEHGTPGKPSHFTTTWEPTVRLLTQTNIPCIFTGYNANEIVEDNKLLQAWGAKVIVEPHLNPFRGLRPFPEIGEDNEFYYTNHSMVMTKGHV